ncbi:MAG: hypothetical protein DBX59_05275 [Bacillota bacterium]|nr:MAG: hypothetical protein DBX59_05275 [Bacillota bacterium]
MQNYFRMQNRFFMFILIGVLGPFYLLWWTADVQNSLRRAEGKGQSGSAAVWLCVLTFGIYGIVWQFQACKAIGRLGGADLRAAHVCSYLLFLSGIVVMPLLMQREINCFAENGFKGGFLG